MKKIDEDHWSNLDMEIHEHPVIGGIVGNIKQKIDHQVNFDHPNWKVKHAEYAKWEAKRWVKLNANKNAKQKLTLMQKLKYLIIQTPLAGIAFFIGSFGFMFGFIDGAKGFKYAKLKAFYFNRIAKEIKRLSIA